MKSDPVSGAAMIALQLYSVGVTHVFALPGADDVIAAALREEGVSVTAAGTGAGAMAMASVHARVTGGLGVVLAGQPPQAFDALAGMAVALADRVPLLVLTESAAVAGGSDPDWMQEVFGRMSRLHLRPDTPDDIGAMLGTLISASREFPPGPVHLGLQSGILTAATSLVDPGSPGPTHVEEPRSVSGVMYVVEALRSAGCPLLVAGDGLSLSDATLLLQLAEAHDLMVVGTPEAKAHLDERRVRVLGPIGPWGRAAANQALLDADVVVALGGLRSLDAAWIDPIQRLISVGPAAGDDGSPDVPIRTDPTAFLTAALRLASGIRGRGETRARLRRMFSLDDASLETGPGMVHPAEVIRTIGSHVDLTTTLVADARPSGRWVLRYLTSRGDNRLVTCTGAGAPGQAVAGGVGAWLARSDRHGAGEWVIVTTGANGFVGFVTAVSTAVAAAAAITWVVFNEHAEPDGPSAGTHPVDHVLLAEALGADARRVTSVEELDEALTWARAHNAPTVIEVIVAGAAPQRYEAPARLPEAGQHGVITG